MKAKIIDFSMGFNRKQRLTLELDGDFRNLFDELKEQEVDVQVKKYRAKRSNNANAYCWQLIGELAEKMDLPSVEIYRNMIRQIGVYKDFGGLTESTAKTLKTAWEKLGLGWICEQLDYEADGDSIVLRCYYGSSSYNTKQMSRLIDSVVADCKALGIETKPPEEVARLLASWKG